MGHQIELYDLTASTQGAEWHGKALIKKAEELLEWAKDNLCFPLVEGIASFTTPDGSVIPAVDENGKGWKSILADTRGLPACEGRDKHPPAYVPLHTPKQDYTPIENLRIIEALEKAFERAGIPFRLSTAGTLSNLARFYLSVDMDELQMELPDGNIIRSFLTAMTSHNGMHDFRVLDSHIRPVCANTVGAIMTNHGDVNFSVRHTKGADVEITNLEETIACVLSGKDELQLALGELGSQDLDLTAMEEITAGYFVLPIAEDGKRIPEMMTAQARNTVDGVVDLAFKGKGNNGRTAYDLWNGATDFWSNGAGVGSEKVSLAKKAYRSNFGSAAAHKTAFSRYLFDTERREQGRKLGAQVLASHDRKVAEKAAANS